MWGNSLDIETAVVLAGGRGLRLAPLTDSVPKALVRIRSKPLLEWVVQWLEENGVRNLVIGVAYEKEKVMDYFGDGRRLGVQVRYSMHTVEGGTAEGFRRAIESVRERSNFPCNEWGRTDEPERGEVAGTFMCVPVLSRRSR